MKRIILPAKEIERNTRVAELMKNRTEIKKQLPEKLTQEELSEVKAFMKDGFTRNESVELLLEKRRLLNTKNIDKESINNWNTGGFVSDTKYKQPIKHKFYK